MKTQMIAIIQSVFENKINDCTVQIDDVIMEFGVGKFTDIVIKHLSEIFFFKLSDVENAVDKFLQLSHR